MENTFNTTISNMEYYSIMVDQLKEVDNMPKNIIPWSIRPIDSLGNDISIGDEIVFVYTDFHDRFLDICKGTIVGFTECFVKIKPKESDCFWRFKELKEGKWQMKEYILRKYNRIIKL